MLSGLTRRRKARPLRAPSSGEKIVVIHGEKVAVQPWQDIITSELDGRVIGIWDMRENKYVRKWPRQ